LREAVVNEKGRCSCNSTHSTAAAEQQEVEEGRYKMQLELSMHTAFPCPLNTAAASACTEILAKMGSSMSVQLLKQQNNEADT
jgi:hypothetical protein